MAKTGTHGLPIAGCPKARGVRGEQGGHAHCEVERIPVDPIPPPQPPGMPSPIDAPHNARVQTKTHHGQHHFTVHAQGIHLPRFSTAKARNGRVQFQGHTELLGDHIAMALGDDSQWGAMACLQESLGRFPQGSVSPRDHDQAHARAPFGSQFYGMARALGSHLRHLPLG